MNRKQQIKRRKSTRWKFPYWHYSSKQLSNMAKNRNRNHDGTFAKGYKKSQVPKGLFNQKSKLFHNSRRNPTNIVRHIKNNITIKGTKDQIREIETQLNNNFNQQEINKLSQNKVLIEVDEIVDKYGKKVAGLHNFEPNKGFDETITIHPDAVFDHETATHELVHLSRKIDNNREGVEKSLTKVLPNGKIGILPKDIALEEAMTVAETIARTDNKVTDTNLGYYSHIHKKTIPDEAERRKIGKMTP